MTCEETVTPERMNAFSDGVFAVIITILVLELRPPKEASFKALLELWPTAISYAISYLFIAIVWVNHHHLLRFPDVATHRLIWGNFAHLFAVSLMPFCTAWIASTRLGLLCGSLLSGERDVCAAVHGGRGQVRTAQGCGGRSVDDAHAFFCDVGRLCRRRPRRASISARRRGNDLPVSGGLPEPEGTGRCTSTQVAW
jgi:hypothetical protein